MVKEPQDDTSGGMPRWVKAVGIVVFVVAALVLAMLLTGVGGDHGPGRHSGAGVAFSGPSR